MTYMLDTNICVYIINKKIPEVIQRYYNCPIDEVCISSVTLAELMYGIQKSNKQAKNWLSLLVFLKGVKVIDFTRSAAQEYGAIMAYLESSGRTIGKMDGLIAGHALAENLTLVTNNTKEFDRVEGLRVEDWTGK